MSDPIGFAMQVDLRLGEENGDLILVVRDNGKGITEEQLSAWTWECESCWVGRHAHNQWYSGKGNHG